MTKQPTDEQMISLVEQMLGEIDQKRLNDVSRPLFETLVAIRDRLKGMQGQAVLIKSLVNVLGDWVKWSELDNGEPAEEGSIGDKTLKALSLAAERGFKPEV